LALEWIIQAQRGWDHTFYYFDDFLPIFLRFAIVSDAPNRYKGDFSQICNDPGFRVKEDQNEEGHCFRFLGIEIDTKAIEA